MAHGPFGHVFDRQNIFPFFFSKSLAGAAHGPFGHASKRTQVNFFQLFPPPFRSAHTRHHMSTTTDDIYECGTHGDPPPTWYRMAGCEGEGRGRKRAQGLRCDASRTLVCFLYLLLQFLFYLMFLFQVDYVYLTKTETTTPIPHHTRPPRVNMFWTPTPTPLTTNVRGGLETRLRLEP